MRACATCRLVLPASYYNAEQWAAFTEGESACLPCLEMNQRRECSSCNRLHRRGAYSRQQWSLPQARSRCGMCFQREAVISVRLQRVPSSRQNGPGCTGAVFTYEALSNPFERGMFRHGMCRRIF